MQAARLEAGRPGAKPPVLERVVLYIDDLDAARNIGFGRCFRRSTCCSL